MQITFGGTIYSLDGEIYNSTFDFTDSTITINSLGSSVSITSAAAEDTFDVVIDDQKVRAINDSISAAFDSNIDYYALGDDSTLTAVTGATKINGIELVTSGTLTVTGKHYDLDGAFSYDLAQVITGLSGGDSIKNNTRVGCSALCWLCPMRRLETIGVRNSGLPRCLWYRSGESASKSMYRRLCRGCSTAQPFGCSSSLHLHSCR